MCEQELEMGKKFICRLDGKRDLGHVLDCVGYLSGDKSYQFDSVCESFYHLKKLVVSRLGVFCRIFASDDPKAELAKLVTETSDLLNPPDFATLDECENWCREWWKKCEKEFDQDLSSVQTFRAKIQDSTSHRTN